MTGSVRVTGGAAVTAAAVRRDDVVVRDGRVVAGPGDAAADVLDASGCLVVPGLVNAHDHLRSLLPATRRADTSALADLIAAGRQAAELAGPDDYGALTALAAARQLLAGTTTVLDHVYPLPAPEYVKAVAAAYQEVGVRGELAYGIQSESDVAAAVAAEVLPADRRFLAPVSLRQTPLDVFRAAVAAADRTGLRLYTHIAETAAEVDWCRAEHGVRPVELLARIGFLRPGTVLVHCVHLDAGEIALLADHGVTVAYCPSNHLKLAKGVAPVVALHEAGVPVRLGVDGMTDLFAEMRQAVYAQGDAAGTPGALPTDVAFAMATAGRGLVPGDPGDLVTVRADGVAAAPLADPVHALVHRLGRGDVRDVVVAGRVVVRDGVLCTTDVAELVSRAGFAVRDLARRSGREVASDWTW